MDEKGARSKPHMSYNELRKFNPYHDERGRFSSGNRSGNPSSVGRYSEEERKAALDEWSDGGYGAIRAAQTGKISDRVRAKQADAIEEYIKDSPVYKGDLYRGIATDTPLDIRPGQIIDMRGISSWTKDEDVAEEFAEWGADNKYFFVTSGLSRAADISKIAMNPGEGEVLVSGKTKFRVKSAQWEPDFEETIVVIEEVIE